MGCCLDVFRAVSGFPVLFDSVLGVRAGLYSGSGFSGSVGLTPPDVEGFLVLLEFGLGAEARIKFFTCGWPVFWSWSGVFFENSTANCLVFFASGHHGCGGWWFL